MRRSAQEQQLCDTEPQDVLHEGRAGRQRHIEAVGNQGVYLTEPAQHRRNQKTRKCAVATGQLMHRCALFDRIVERSLAAEHRPDQIERDMACGRRFGHQSTD